MMTAVFHFDVPGLWVAAELQGTRHETSFEGYAIVLVFPNGSEDFGTDSIEDISLPTIGGSVSRESDDILLAIQIRMLRVELQIDQELPGAEAGEGEPSQRLTAATELLSAMAEVARRFMGSYLDLVRCEEDQYWLGPSAKEPVVTWRSQLYENGLLIPVGYLDPFHVSFQLATLTAVHHAELLTQVAVGAAPGLPEALLNDARFAAFQPRPNLRQATLSAAIACEIKVKQVLFAIASLSQQSILNLLLENPRDWSVGAAALFDKAIKAISGRSLREDDTMLYRDVVLLYENRNKIAHRGGSGLSTDDVLREHIASAGKVFNWLAEISAASTSDP